MFRPEVNRFVDLVHSRPDRIFCGERVNGLTQERLTPLLQQITTAPRVLLELGSGSGSHLIGKALKEPELFCIGCELRYKRAFRTIEKADVAGVRPEHLVVCRVDARALLRQLPDGCVDELYVLYPDPWDKSRWLKNRLLSKEPCEQIARVLKPGGRLEYRTDHQEYFKSALSTLNQTPHLKELFSSSDYRAQPTLCDGVVLSEFEQLFLSQNLPLCRTVFSR